MTLPLTAHQLLSLRRHYPDARIEERSISSVRIVIEDCWIEVSRPPFLDWVVGQPCVTGSMRYPPAGHDIWSLRRHLLQWFEPSREA